jgi:hypothetical protein
MVKVHKMDKIDWLGPYGHEKNQWQCTGCNTVYDSRTQATQCYESHVICPDCGFKMDLLTFNLENKGKKILGRHCSKCGLKGYRSNVGFKRLVKTQNGVIFRL